MPGPTGVETAGALADTRNRLIPKRIGATGLPINIHLVDPSSVVLAPFSERAHEYARKVLEDRGVHLELGTKVDEVGPDRVVLSDGREILAAHRRVGGRDQGPGARRRARSSRRRRADGSRSVPTSR